MVLGLLATGLKVGMVINVALNGQYYKNKTGEASLPLILTKNK